MKLPLFTEKTEQALRFLNSFASVVNLQNDL